MSQTHNSMKKLLKKLHLYLALALCLPLVLQGLTGAILVFQKPISNSLLRQNHTFSEGEIQTPNALITAAQTQIPEGFSATLVKLPAEENSPATIRFTKKGEKTTMLEALIDPVSLEVLKIKNPETDFFRLIKKFHVSLFIPGQSGKNIVGSFGFVMIFMSLSGLVLWWPKPHNLKRAFTFEFAAKGRRFNRDLHSAIGFWTLWVLLVTSFAGVFLAFTPATTATILAIFPGQDLRASASAIKVEPTEKSLSLDEATSLATSSVSTDEKLLSLSLPAKKDQPLCFNFAPKNYSEGEPAITVFVDQFQQKIIEKRDPALFSVGETIVAWQHALHAGEGLGWLWKIVVFGTGFLPLLFSITGITMWIQKKRNKARVKA